ncbi:MAG: aspartate aminotransferase family protein [Elusimicrobia bacterium]|nr:aspartate aminotransferase family protein [Elusimicrobiota bacterium]
MTLASLQKAEKKHLIQTYDRYPAALSHGRGAYLYGPGGERYLDFLSGIGVMALGYAHPAVTKVIRKQSGRLVHASNLFYTPFQAELAKRLCALSGLDRAFFCNSGTEAWEAALKFARAFARDRRKRGRVRFLALEGSFHGRTMGAVATTHTAKYREPFAPLMPGVSFVRFDDAADLRRRFSGDVCAVCVETVQGEGGVRPLSKAFLREAARLTRKTGALLLCDEIQCGLGRTGRMFAFQHHGLKPDLVTLAKPLACGLPLGAVLATDRVAAAITPGMHGTTFGGGPLACAVALKVLDVIEGEGLLERVRESGAYFLSRLRELAAAHASVREARGLGLMLALELKEAEAAKAVQKRLLERGIIINRTHDTVLRFLPPYIVTRRQIDQVVDSLDAAL